MGNNIFCGQCGTSNPNENNFCFSCGQKLIKASQASAITAPKHNINPENNDIKETLEKLIKCDGFLTIVIGDYYVQFSNSLDNEQIFCDAVSSVFLPSVGNKNKEFKQLGFTLDPSANYNKFIQHADFSINDIIAEIKIIFETIYDVKFSSYTIESDFGV